MSETKSMLPKDFEPIRSAKDKRANAVEIRRLVKLSGGKSFRGGAGFLEASIEDIRAKGGSMFGRCATRSTPMTPKSRTRRTSSGSR